MYPPVNFWKFITSIYYHKLGDFAILLPKISNRQNYQKFTVDFVFYIKKIKENGGDGCNSSNNVEKGKYQDKKTLLAENACGSVFYFHFIFI